MSNEPDNIDRTHRLGPLAEEGFVGEEISGRDLAIVLSRYDIGAVDRISDYKRGSRRSPKMHIVSSMGEFLLKRRAVGHDEHSRVLFAHTIQATLAEHRFPVAGLVSTTEGSTLVQHDGRIYELFRFITGKRFDKSNPAASEAGRVLAHFHSILLSSKEEPVVGSGTFHHSQQIPEVLGSIYQVLTSNEDVSALEGMNDTIEYIRAKYETSANKIQNLEWDSLGPQLVHGDWHPGNMLYADSEIIAVIDFDSLRFLPRITDVANGALQFSMRMGTAENVDSWGEGFRGHTIQSFVQAYDQFSQVPLFASERAMIPDLMVEALIVESVIPIWKTGSFGRVAGSTFLRLVEKKLKWLEPRMQRVIDVIQPPLSGEDSFA
ncbi:MAG TPA: phosphotransferase [Phycisphaerales bacterium]|nr:phosphotransferase [Phycisphaerales bacterium]